MQKLIAKYGLAAHLAFMAVAPLFLSAGCCLWLAGLGLVWLFMSPSKIRGEYVHEARVRVLHSVLKDPLFWILLLVVAYATVRCLNSGIVAAYDFETTTWKIAAPTVPYLPGSTPKAGLLEFAVSFVLLVVLQGCLHALGRSARYMFCGLVSLVAGIVSLVWCYSLFLGKADVLSRAACSTLEPIYAGSVFGVCLLAGIVGLFASFERKWRWLTLPLMFGIGGCAAGVFAFAPATVQLAYFSAALLLLVYSFFRAWRVLSNSGEFRFLVVFVVSLLLGGACVMLTVPKDLLDARVVPYMTGEFLPADFLGLRATLADMSLRTWKIHPWLGGGLGSFPLSLNFLATENDWAILAPGQVAPLNGFWFVLAERGILGALVLGVPLALLFGYHTLRFVKGVRFGMPGPACFAGPLAVAAVLAESFVSSSLAQPVLVVVSAAILAVSVAAFPKGE